MSGGFVCSSSDLHPFECDGPSECIHCDRRGSETHDLSTCALCDPDYDGVPNPFWNTTPERDSAEAT